MLASIGPPEISFMFFLGVLFIPRMMMLWLGAIVPGSAQAIAGFWFAPRIMICCLISSGSNETSGALVILWIFAVVLDLIGLIFKGVIGVGMFKAQHEVF